MFYYWIVPAKYCARSLGETRGTSILKYKRKGLVDKGLYNPARESTI
jgi:hypothetical protein